MDYWKELIDERMTPKCKQLFDEILQENGIPSEKTIKKTIDLYKKNILMNRRELLIIFYVLLEMITFDLLQVCFYLVLKLNLNENERDINMK